MSRAFDRAGNDGPGEPFLPGQGSTSDSVANADPSRSSGEEDQAESRPPRPPNAWILYRAAKSAHIRAEIEEAADPQQRVSSRQRQSEVSKQLSQMWKAESKEVKDHYGALAEEKRSEHRLRYPVSTQHVDPGDFDSDVVPVSRKELQLTFLSHLSGRIIDMFRLDAAPSRRQEVHLREICKDRPPLQRGGGLEPVRRVTSQLRQLKHHPQADSIP